MKSFIRFFYAALPLLMAAFLLGGSIMQAKPTDQKSPMDKWYSKKELGCIVNAKETIFRLFAPRATEVKLTVFDKHDDATGSDYVMKRDKDGVWEYSLPGKLYGKYYGYRVGGPAGQGEMFNPSLLLADPYSKAVATKNTFHEEAKTLILDPTYDWGKDTYVIPKDHNKLVIYETHVRDLTVDPSSGIESRGTYKGLLEKGKTGGLSYLKGLDVNAVEFLPLQKFGTIELPYRDSSIVKDGYDFNTWNPYERNHWGYMTSYFFTPETYYATDGTIERDKYNGVDGRAVREFKDVVKTYHKEGIAVLMDVVFNHVSNYDYNPFKYIDKMYYFRTDSLGRFIMNSGCGNDLNTERLMARRFIVDCVSYWMKEYHIDGFRFDLAAMIDWETCKEITKAAKKINPNVILIAEAWGSGRYELAHFSDIGWASWNDQIRNGVKGQNPNDGLGFIFEKFQGGNTKKSVMNFANGTLREDGGPFVKKEHSISYLESHDDNTMGDFIRMGNKDVKAGEVIQDIDKNAKLTPDQLTLNKLAALFLFTSRGPLMVHEGQEYARSKVIPKTSVPDTNAGKIDHNSYDKDNETNYLNYNQVEMNRALVDYYKGLISLRKTHPAFANAPKSAVKQFKTEDDFFIAYQILKKASGKIGKDYIVLLNGDPKKAQALELPKGDWKIIANGEKIDLSGSIGSASGSITVPPTSGIVLMK
jgi:pullulanase/glycogen debranching enzyme